MVYVSDGAENMSITVMKIKALGNVKTVMGFTLSKKQNTITANEELFLAVA